MPKHSNPNLLPIGETFGFVVFLKDALKLIIHRTGELEIRNYRAITVVATDRVIKKVDRH